MDCSWCYMHNNTLPKDELSEMNLETFSHTIKIASELNVKILNIMGGEPTMHKELFKIIKEAKKYNIPNVTVTTNGIRLQNLEYAKKIKESGLDVINFSLKSSNEKDLKSTTGFEDYSYIEKSLANCRKCEIPFGILIVLTKKDIDNIVAMTKFAFDNGAKFISYIAYDEYNSSQIKNSKYFEKNDPKYILNKFSECYEELNNISNGSFTLYLSYPLCIVPEDLLKKIAKNKQTASICPIIKKFTLTVDCDGSLFPCNVICDKSILNANINNFKDSKEVADWWNSDNTHNIYEKLSFFPSKECLDCDLKEYCGGGCVCQWTNYNFEELKANSINDINKSQLFQKMISHDTINYKNISKKEF